QIVNKMGTSTLYTANYDSFGNIAGQTGTGDRFNYAARELEAAIDQYHNRARWYDPRIGGFTGEDPIGFDGGDANLFRYVGNNPINASDPEGEAKRNKWAQMWIWHHNLVQQHFPKKVLRAHKLNINIHAAKYGTIMLRQQHMLLHSKVHFNRQWQQWMTKQRLLGNTLTKSAIHAKMNAMKRAHAVYYSRSMQATVAHTTWRNMSTAAKRQYVQTLQRTRTGFKARATLFHPVSVGLDFMLLLLDATQHNRTIMQQLKVNPHNGPWLNPGMPNPYYDPTYNPNAPWRSNGLVA
ncbi:MAG: RHS repeat-associated core domain-containing protein, partial [Pirellulales bacterium]